MKKYPSLPVRAYDLKKPMGENHCLGDFIASEVAVGHNLFQQYVFQERVENNLYFLVTKFIDPAEDFLGETFQILSGYRCRALDYLAAREGSTAHLSGCAVDIMPPTKLSAFLDKACNMEFDELFIFRRYIHIAVRDTLNRGLFKDYRG